MFDIIMIGLISPDELDRLVEKNSDFKSGFLLDTNILISASLPIDPKNEEAESLIQKLAKLQIPIYANINIRAEFLEIQRRILIPECLIEFYEEAGSILDDVLNAKLKSIQTSYRKSLQDKKVYKFSDERIKEFRDILATKSTNEKDGWQIFCETYLHPQISTVWSAVVKHCNLNFIKIRDNENHPLLTQKISWYGACALIGNYGIGSADAMIVNLLLSSKLKVVATADGDIRYLSPLLHKNNKLVLVI